MWSNKSKNSAETPSLVTKIETKLERGRILTPDGCQVLVGEHENLILVWRIYETLWNNVVSKVASIWSNKSKTPIT